MKATALVLIDCLSAAHADEAWKPIPAGTVILGQVSYVPEPEEVINGFTFAPQPAEFKGIPVQAKNYATKSEIQAVKASCGIKKTRARHRSPHTLFWPCARQRRNPQAPRHNIRKCFSG